MHTEPAREKVSLSPDKRTWHPSPLISQVVLVTTCNADGTSNIAPKSWVSMMAFDPPLIALGCNRQHWTAQNILERREFVLNMPGADMAEQVWRCHSLPHPRPVEALGLTPIPSTKVVPPRVQECKAHVECTFVDQLTFGGEIILLGKIVAVSVDRQALEAEDPYAYMQMFVFLEDGHYGVVEHARITVT